MLFFQTLFQRMPNNENRQIIGNQTELGKAFEYACADVIVSHASDEIHVELLESAPVKTARRYFSYLDSVEKVNFRKGALAAIRVIKRFEPNLFNGSDTMSVCLQTDSQGMAGDVRDVLCTRKGWTIGLSCKHNHEAVKHSRLSDRIDFGQEWFEIPCSNHYFSEIRKVFMPLRHLRDERLEADRHKPALWSEIPDKENLCYVPVLTAFMEELRRLDAEHPRIIPERLIRYLIGRNDFYKVIMNESRHYTQIEAININGTLNKRYQNKRSLVDVPRLKMPTKFYEIGFKEGSKNTIYVVCDGGWNVSMRIHNASSRVEPSLKFDVQLLAMPSSILTQIEPWESDRF